MDRNIQIDKFIGIYDGYILKEMCDPVIKYYEDKNKMDKSFTRLSHENISTLLKSDTTVALNLHNVDAWFDQFKVLFANFDMALKHYIKNSGIGDAYSIKDFNYTSIRIQKTLPTEGYHIWHVEYDGGYENNKRAMAFTIYLNDVEEGGETEFLYQSIRVKPKTGRIVIWPAAFPFVHRGNPPISGEKYLLTSWMLFK
jgi:hypothetical protein